MIKDDKGPLRGFKGLEHLTKAETAGTAQPGEGKAQGDALTCRYPRGDVKGKQPDSSVAFSK